MDLTPEQERELYNAYNRPNVPEDLTEAELSHEVHLGAFNQAMQMRHALSTTDLNAAPKDISITLPFTPEAIIDLRPLPLRTHDVDVHGSTSEHVPPHFEEVPALYTEYFAWLNTEIAKVNGMSNEFWGWGLEDDDFYLRLNTNRSNTLLHLHTRNRRRNFAVDEYRKKAFVAVPSRCRTAKLCHCQSHHSFGAELLACDV